MKTRVKSDDGIELSTICRQLKLESSDSKRYLTDCANTEGVFRITQSIPWLVKFVLCRFRPIVGQVHVFLPQGVLYSK